MNTQQINEEIKKLPDTNGVSDGYHTFGELYDHRITLYLALCRTIDQSVGHKFTGAIWRSKYHHDGSTFEGWFILGTSLVKGEQISYHLPMDRWNEASFAVTLDKAPEWDGHTPADVLERLKKL